LQLPLLLFMVTLELKKLLLLLCLQLGPQNSQLFGGLRLFYTLRSVVALLHSIAV
jgi:hypothetical protein